MWNLVNQFVCRLSLTPVWPSSVINQVNKGQHKSYFENKPGCHYLVQIYHLILWGSSAEKCQTTCRATSQLYSRWKLHLCQVLTAIVLEVVTDLMEEREHLRFTILCLVVTIILLALLVLACALALGFHFQKRKPKMRKTRPKRRNPVERRESIVSTTTILMDSTDCSDDDDAAAQKPIQPIYLL